MRKNTIAILAGAILFVSVFSLICLTNDCSSANVQTPISEWYAIESTEVSFDNPGIYVQREYPFESATQPFQIFSIGEKNITGMYLNVPFEGEFSKQRFSFDIKSTEQNDFVHVFGEIIDECIIATEIHFKDASLSSIVTAKCLTYHVSTIEGYSPAKPSFICLDDFVLSKGSGTIKTCPNDCPYFMMTTDNTFAMDDVSQSNYLSLVNITVPDKNGNGYRTITCVATLYSSWNYDSYCLYGVDNGETCDGSFTIDDSEFDLKISIDSESKSVDISVAFTILKRSQ